MATWHLIELDDMRIGYHYSAGGPDGLIAALHAKAAQDVAEDSAYPSGYTTEGIAPALAHLERCIREASEKGPGLHEFSGYHGDTSWAWQPWIIVVPD